MKNTSKLTKIIEAKMLADFEIRFNQARLKLNKTLKELENAITNKLKDKANSSQKNYQPEFNQAEIVKNLSQKIKKLEEEIIKLNLENHNLQQSQIKGFSIIKDLEADLITIEEIVTGEKND